MNHHFFANAPFLRAYMRTVRPGIIKYATAATFGIMNNKVLLLVFLAVAAFPGSARCEWEKLRSSDAPLAVVYASTGAYELAYTVGENCASPYELRYGSDTVLSGYLSLIPSSIMNQGFSGFDSTSGVIMDGNLWGANPDDAVKLLFSTDISTTLSTPGIVVKQFRDNTGAEIAASASWPVTTSYSGQRLVIVPSASWPKGSVFSVRYSSAIMDINGLPVSGETTVYFSVIMDHQSDNTATVLNDRRVRVVIPAKAYDNDFFMTLSTGTDRPEIITANAKLAGAPGSPEFLNALNVRPYDAAGNPAEPNSACVVTLPYDLSDAALTEKRLKASNLSVWLLDETRKLWVKQTGAALDTVSRAVSLPVKHFSSYALMGLPDNDLNPVYAFPVPFRPNAGDRARYGSWDPTDLITFTNLPASGNIRIYTISGSLVRKLDITGPQEKWDVRNSAGEIVASGVYLWEVTVGSERKTGKLVIIK